MESDLSIPAALAAKLKESQTAMAHRNARLETDLMTPAALAAKLEKSLAALAQWRYLGKGPQFIKLGRSIRYRASDVEAWLDQQTMQRTGEPGSAA